MKTITSLMTITLIMITFSLFADSGEGVSATGPLASMPCIYGKIIDAQTSLPLIGVQVILTGQGTQTWQTQTAADGHYSFIGLSPGSFNLSVAKQGYQSSTLSFMLCGCLSIENFNLVSTGADFVEVTDDLTMYADQITEAPSKYYTLSGNVNINGIVGFNGTVKIDKRPNLYYPEISGNSGYSVLNIQGSNISLLNGNLPYKFYGNGNQLIAKELAYFAEIPVSMGGFPMTLGGIEIDPNGAFASLKVIPKLPFPLDKILKNVLEDNNLSIPEILSKISLEMIYSHTGGLNYAGSIEDLSADFQAFKITNAQIEFNTLQHLFGAGFKLKIPGGLDNLKIANIEAADSSAEIPDFMVEIQDPDGHVLKQTTFPLLFSNPGAFGLSFLEVGVDVEFISGAINKLILSISTKIPIDATGLFITQMTGGVKDMTNKDNWRIEANVDIETGLEIPGLGSPIKLNDFGVSIHPLNYFSGSGAFEIFNQEVTNGSIAYDVSKKSLSGECNLDLQDILVGNFKFGLRNSQFNGSGIVTIKTPSDLPVYLYWAENKKVMASQATIDNEQITSEFNLLGINFAEKMIFGNPAFPWFHYQVGLDLEHMIQIWKGQKSGKQALQFQIPKNCPNLLIVASDTLSSSIVTFSLTSPSGAIFDSINTTYQYFPSSGQTVMVVKNPSYGDWTFTTTLNSGLRVNMLGANQKPVVLITSPTTNESSSSTVKLNFNDYSSNLSVKVYFDNNNKDYDGTIIQEFSVMNNASITFDWQTDDVPDGIYYIYCRVDDGKNAPVYQYSTGSILVKHDLFNEIPQNEVVSQQGDSIKISWLPSNNSEVNATRVYVKNFTTGKSDVWSVIGADSLFLKNLKIGQAYQIALAFVKQNGTEGPKNSGNSIVFMSYNLNNPPFFTIDLSIPWIFVENETKSIALSAGDADGDVLTYALLNDTVGISLIGDQLTWTPTFANRGVFPLSITVTDGQAIDTITQNIIVYTQEQVGVKLDFSANKLYENDKMFITVRNFKSSTPFLSITLKNLNTNQQTTVSCRKVNDFDYIGQFELSTNAGSSLSVSNGNIISATYVFDTSTYTATAVYDNMPQPSDTIAPSTISDLSLTKMDHNNILAKWVAPGNDNTLGKAFKYDIRYAYQPILTEADYLIANKLSNFPYPSPFGSFDSILVNMDSLLGILSHDTIWFSIKAEDEMQNRGQLSNSPFLRFYLNPLNISSEIQDSYKIHLKWDGPNTGSGFSHYKLWRRMDSLAYVFVTDTITQNSFIDNLFLYPDNVYQYALQSVFTIGQSDTIYSTPIGISRFANVIILAQLSDTNVYDSINFSMTALDTIYNQSFVYTTNVTGTVLLDSVFKSSYVITLSRYGYFTIEDTIAVSNTANSFIYSLLPRPHLGYLSGHVTYNNNQGTPLSNVEILLKNNLGQPFDTAYTDITGYYHFELPPQGYSLNAKSTHLWGGVNSIDALLIQKYFLSIVNLQGLFLRAADVNNSLFINSSDALLTAKRFVHLVNSFSAGDWVFDTISLNIPLYSSIVFNLHGLCYGDVNGSYLPTSKSSPSLFLTEDGSELVDQNFEILLPVRSNHKYQLSSASLVINFNPDNIDISEIIPGRLKADDQGSIFLSNILDSEIRIAWYSLTPMDIKIGDPLFTIKARVKKDSSPLFAISEESNLADNDDQIIPDAEISIPKLVYSEEGFIFNCCVPNPINQSTEISYTLPNDGTMKISLYNSMGSMIEVILDESISAGAHNFVFDASKYSNGIYWLKADYNCASDHTVRTAKVVVVK